MTFNAELFLHQELDQANETAYTPVPAGDYQAIISDIALNARDINGREVLILDVKWDIIDDELRALQNMQTVIVRQGIFIDIEGGAIAFGTNKNVALGRLRDALGQNDNGKPWSMADLRGAGPAYIRVAHRENPNNPDNPYTDVKMVSAVPLAA